MIIRNDDVCATTPLSEVQRFCELCDRYGFQALHAITPVGSDLWKVDCKWDNERIRRETGMALFSENKPVVQYLLNRHDCLSPLGKGDLIAIHGLWHTHKLTPNEIKAGVELLWDSCLKASYFVPPFNEADPHYGVIEMGRRSLRESAGEAPRLEEYLDRPEDLPEAKIVYLHSHRFQRGPFTWDQLDRCLAALSTRLQLSAATAR